MKHHTSQTCSIAVFAVTYLGQYVLFFNCHRENLRAPGPTAHVPRGASHSSAAPSVPTCVCSDVNADLRFSSSLISLFSQRRRAQFSLDAWVHFKTLMFFYVGKSFHPALITETFTWVRASAPAGTWTGPPSSRRSFLLCPHWSPQRCVSVWMFLLRHHRSSLWTTGLVH